MVAGIIGAAGFTGAELVRILAKHPGVDFLRVSSTSHEGKNIADIYPNFLGAVGIRLENSASLIAASGVVFAALPHGAGDGFAAACAERGVHYIDLSADFRFGEDEDTYSAWYGKKYGLPDLRKISVYGLPELNRQRIKAAADGGGPVIIANPGCYPTAASLAAFPALAKGLCGGGPIIVDAASGVTGGGREPARAYHFPECSDSMTPYLPGAHRHAPEISRSFSFMERTDPSRARPLVFTPHLAPMNRGILCTVYIPLSAEWSRPPASPLPPRPPSGMIKETSARIHALYAEFYRDEPFVRVLPEGVLPATGRVRRSNFCDISVSVDQSGETLIVMSAIDNMVKGAAGQAVQNMNILFGFDERLGLDAVPALF